MKDSAKAAHRAGMDFASDSNKRQSGFLAQEVNKVLNSTNGFSSTIVSVPADSNVNSFAINYAEVVVPLVKAVQELSHKVDSLLGVTQAAGQITMQNNTGGATNNSGTSAASLGTIASVNTIDLASGSALIYQNAPNPFGDGTTIKYYVPENITNAQIVFYDEFGGQLKNFAVTETGNGQLNVTAGSLAPGTYSYSLIINGKIIDTKKMIKQ